MEGEETI
jgi:hypothetical protein